MSSGNGLKSDRHGSLVVRLSPREHEVVGSIPGQYRPKSLKLVIVGFPMTFAIMGIALQLACQCQDNGLVQDSRGNMDL